jgi:uncharacterized membrane protein YdbT with pleckstrin-like domain
VSLNENLIANEEIIYETQKHWMAPLRDSVVPALLLLGAYAVGWISPDSQSGLVGAVGNLLDLVKTGLVIGGIGWIVYNVVVWRTAVFAVTNLRVIREEGLISRRSSATMLRSVTDVQTRIPFVGGRIGYGDIVVYTQAGKAGVDRFKTITHPVEFRDQIMTRKLGEETLRVATAERSQPAAAPPASAPAPAAPDQMAVLASLAQLRDSGAITPEEFESKKAEILARI